MNLNVGWCFLLSVKCTDAFSIDEGKNHINYAENVRRYHEEFSHPGDQNLCTLALTRVPSYKTAFMTTHDYLVSNISDAWRNVCRSSQKVLLLAHFNQNWKVMTILVNSDIIFYENLISISQEATYTQIQWTQPTHFLKFSSACALHLPATYYHIQSHWNICSKLIHTLWFHKACTIMFNYRNHISSYYH